MDDSDNKKYYMLKSAYKESFVILHNWALAINSGGVVAILSYIASRKANVTVGALWIFGVLASGVIFGLLWAVVNYLASRKGLLEYNAYLMNKNKPKNFELSPAVYCMNHLAWLLGVICLIRIPIGFYLGFCEVQKVLNNTCQVLQNF